MNILQLSWAYIKARALNSTLNIILLSLGIATIVLLLIFSEQMQKRLLADAEGIDLVVGAKGSPMQLMLSSIYHIDVPTGNIPYSRLAWLREHGLVKEALPLALGDSYKGFRIVGTEYAYPSHYDAKLAQGDMWTNNFEVVIGSRVADELHLHIGDRFFGSHGMVEGGHVHEDRAYKVVGILAQDHSVMDRLILTSIPTVWVAHNLTGEHDDHDHNHDEHDHHQDHGHHEDDGHSAEQHRAMGVSHADDDPHHEEDHDHSAHEHHDNDGHSPELHRALGVAHSDDDPHHEAGHDHELHGHHEDDGHSAEQHRAMGVSHNDDDPHHDKEHDHASHGHHEDDGHSSDLHRAMGVSHGNHDPHHEEDHANEHVHKEHGEHDGHDHHGHHHAHDHELKSIPAINPNADKLLEHIDTSKQEITALLLKFKSPLAAVQLPLQINRQSEMQAARPAQETSRLFALLGGVIETLYGFGFLLVITSGLGVFIALYNAMKDRRYDLAIMRSLGASRGKLLAGVVLEGVLLVLMGTALGFALGHGAAYLLGEYMPKAKEMGLTGWVWVNKEWAVIGLSLGVALLASLIPALQAYRTDIAEALSKSK